jgi:hypothetical protein
MKYMDFIKKFVSIGIVVFVFYFLLSRRLEEKTYLTYETEVTRQFKNEVYKELHLPCIAGGGSMRNDIECISLGFLSTKNMGIEEARNLEVELIERFLRIINNHQNIRPYLREYPFPVSRIDILISFQPAEYTKEALRTVFLAHGCICYFSHDNRGRESVPDFEEPYEEAYNLVKMSRPGISKIQKGGI